MILSVVEFVLIAGFLLTMFLQVVIPLLQKKPIFPFFRKSASLQSDLEKAQADLSDVALSKEVASAQAQVKAETSTAQGWVKTEFAKAEAAGSKALATAEADVKKYATEAEEYAANLLQKTTGPAASTTIAATPMVFTTPTSAITGTAAASPVVSPAPTGTPPSSGTTS